jgi:hypothetical protein
LIFIFPFCERNFQYVTPLHSPSANSWPGWMSDVNLWNVTTCSPVEVHWCFGGVYCLCAQGQRVSCAANHKKQVEVSLFLTWLALSPWRWRQ